MQYGIDISSWNTIDFNKLINNINFAILRIGYGVQYLPTQQKDRKFEEFYSALNSNKPIGIYYYQYANEIGEGTKEAENCLKYLDGKHLDLPIYYDCEDSSVAGLDKDTLTNILIEFCTVIENAGYKTGIYANKYFFNNKIDVDKIKKYSLWCASYGSNHGDVEDTAKWDKEHDIWQYTSRGNIEGLSGFADLDLMPKEISNNINIETKEINHVIVGDENILKIQQTLNSRYSFNIAEDGIYGSETKKVLTMALQTEFNTQCNVGLVVDGIFGNNTYNACINVKNGASGNITWLIQAMLYCKGFNPNGIDGIFGRGTSRAVRSMQYAKGLIPDAIVGKETFSKLFR